MQLSVVKYQSEYKEVWDNFVRNSKNGTFLFERDFMEYHSDRFKDYSLMVFENTKLIALLPANIKDDVVYSHQGLTYGGVLFLKDIYTVNTLLVYREVLAFINRQNILQLVYKQIPNIYYDTFADENLYAAYILKAKLYRRDLLSVINLKASYKLNELRRRSIKKGVKNDTIVKKENSFDAFWNEVLIPNLKEKHGVGPVHSLAEIQKLHNLFPENICQYNAYINNEIVAGVTLFINKKTVHCQYISGLSSKNELGGLDFLFNYLITKVFNTYDYFDFGISNEELNDQLNKGLLFWKESYGARSVFQDFYLIETQNYTRLDEV